MKHPDVEKSRPESLAEMMDLGVDARTLWMPGELEAILEHQLQAPIEFDLSFLGEEAARSRASFAPVQGRPIETFGDLFAHPHPPVELLDQTRRFAKACRLRRDSPLPDEIATVLYVLSIVVAMTKCNERITKMDDATLRYSLDWALSQPWVDASVRRLLEEGLVS